MDSASKSDIIAFFNQFKGKDSTLGVYQMIIKKYFTDVGKPELVKWIKIKQFKETLKSDDILTTEDINKMIEATDSYYYRAVISFLFESGCRISEARLLKFKDFVETSDGMTCNIPTSKTSAGYRKIILPLSSQYIRNLKSITDGKDDDIVFHIKECHTNVTLQKIGAKANLTKKVTPHRMRHAQATVMVQLGYNEAIIRKKLGWTPTSNMIARYQHFNDSDVINATLEKSGIEIRQKPLSNLKTADTINIVDAGMQLSQLQQKNEDQAHRIEEMDTKIEYITGLLKGIDIDHIKPKSLIK
ncbi:MAG: site-specific integrase [Candidatus Methanoperedens sp.]|nr:site-specific integrase [Candidatus Methanoperedens sp.]